jgi:hypothetical protein
MKKSFKGLLLVAPLLTLPAVVQAQFTFTTNADNTITIARGCQLRRADESIRIQHQLGQRHDRRGRGLRELGQSSMVSD